MAPYKAVIFDLDDTLLDFAACEINALKQGFMSVQLNLAIAENWEQIWKTYEPISSMYWNRRQTDGLTRQQVMEYSIRDTLVELDQDTNEVSTIGDVYWETFCHTAHPNPGAQEILEFLHRHLVLGLLSNGYTAAQRGRLKQTNWSRFFRSVVISDEVGVSKPDPRIFEIAIQQLGVAMNEALYVGDSLENDLVGTVRAGMDFCHYKPDPDAAAYSVHMPRFIIQEFQELPEILDLS